MPMRVMCPVSVSCVWFVSCVSCVITCVLFLSWVSRECVVYVKFEGNNEEIPLITDEEIQAAINKLKKGKASDNNGIRA